MFKITVVEIPLGNSESSSENIVRFEVMVDSLNLQAVIAAINRTPRKSRAKKEPKA